jgi:DNA modification methylase
MNNQLYYGDNLEVLRKFIKDESIDLCYIDPPFNSKRNYNQIYNNIGKEDRAQAQAFIDTWTWDDHANQGLEEILSNYLGHFTAQSIDLISGLTKVLGKGSLLAYLVSMTLRIAEIHRVLKPTGSFYLHCDPSASHYLKLVLDAIFCPQGGEFQNEIIWYYRRWTGNANSFLKMHDVILFYTKKSQQYTFNTVYTQYSGESFFRKQHYHTRIKNGDVYITDIDKQGVKDNDVWESNNLSDIERILDYVENEEILNSLLLKYLQLIKQEFTIYNLDAKEFKTLENIIKKLQIRFGDVFPISILNSQAKERLGYPTQKPETLLERIIKASSNENDVILDAYCGCGTTVAVAQKLNRNWIGIDITYQSISLILKRLEDSFGKDVSDQIKLHGIPQDMDSAIALSQKPDDRTRKEFEKWAILTYTNNRGIINPKKGKDQGIDGIVYFRGNNRETEKIIIQVKSGNIKSGDIRDLQGTMSLEQAQMGIFITLKEPTKDMITTAKQAGIYKNEFMKQNYDKISIVTIREIIEEEKRLTMVLIDEVLKSAEKIKEAKGEQLDMFDNG